jgi:predicted nucleic acid-binding protein
VNLILDACSIINLTNGNVFTLILNLSTYFFFVGPQTIGECNETIRQTILECASAGKITILQDENISSALFLELIDLHRLGDGETECLTFGKLFGYGICSDDRKARRVASDLIGADGVTGSLGLLKLAVDQELITAQRAFEAFQQMKLLGAFFPDIKREFFESNLGTA